MKRASEDGATPWERATASLDFTFDGFTDLLPVPGDGVNVIGCGNANGEHAIPTVTNGRIVEADMLLAASTAWTYTPCEQADNSCTPTGGTPSIHVFITHGFGHWLWLTDMTDPNLDYELTMSPGTSDTISKGSRHWATLALGETIAVRELYPTTSPVPPIFSP